jgi:hypothetical protein
MVVVLNRVFYEAEDAEMNVEVHHLRTALR